MRIANDYTHKLSPGFYEKKPIHIGSELTNYLPHNLKPMNISYRVKSIPDLAANISCRRNHPAEARSQQAVTKKPN